MSKPTICDICDEEIERKIWARNGKISDGEHSMKIVPSWRRRIGRILLGPVHKFYSWEDGRTRGGYWQRMDTCPSCRRRIEKEIKEEGE